jgi:Phage regulatory protein Rha (Phage_pRha).
MNLVLTGGNAQTMTLKEITDMLDVRHNDAMNAVEKMVTDPEFGTATKISYHLPASYRKRAETIQTYQLNKRQSIAVAARLNTALLMRIVDRWQELEEQQYSLASTVINAVASLRASMANAQEVASRLECAFSQCTPAQLPPQEAREADVIKYLMKKGALPTYVFQRNRTNAKPWSLITPKSAIGETMRSTFAELERKGVLSRNGSSITLNTIH